METLDSTIINTALPAIARDLNESPIHMYAVTIAYSLTIAILIPASGWLADRFGIRRVFLSAITIFSIGSLCCALAQTFEQLVTFRVLQGVGGSMLLPIGRLAVLRTFPREKFLAAISFVAIPALIGPLIGPTLGGFLAEVASWHWIFFINIPIGVIGLIATAKYMPPLSLSGTARFDGPGYVMLALFMLCTSLAIEGLSGLHLPVSSVLLLAVIGLASLISYALHAGRAKFPIFSLKLFSNRTFAIGLSGNLFARIGSSGMPFMVPVLLQIGFGYSPLHAGLIMLPMAIAAIFSKRVAAAVIERYGYRRFLSTNTLLVGFSIMSFALTSKNQPLWLLIIQMGIFGTFNSLQFTAMNSLTLKDLDDRNASSGNSLLSMIQMLAISFGVTCAGALLTIFNENFAGYLAQGSTLSAFHFTFLVIGMMTCSASWIFWQLESEEARSSGEAQAEMK